MKLKIFLILFFYLIDGGIEGANLPSNVAPIQHTTSNVGEIAPASYENVKGVKYPNIPFYGNPKISKEGETSSKKEKTNDSGKVDTSNRFSVLEGLTEENQRKMFGNKGKDEESCEKVFEDGKNNKIKKKFSISKNRKLLQENSPAPAPSPDSAPIFDDDDKNIWCPKVINVMVMGSLALSGLYQMGDLKCKISPDFGINRNLPSCIKTNETHSQTNFNCDSKKIVEASEKKFFEHYNKNQIFELYCPIGKDGEMEKVAEANATRINRKYKKNWKLNFVQKKEN